TGQISTAGDVGVWAVGLGDFANLGSDSKQTRLTTGGIVIGLPHLFSKSWLAGIAAGYDHTWSKSMQSDAGWGGGYAAYFWRGFYLLGAASAGGDAYTTHRNSLLGVATGSSDGAFFGSFAETGYDWKLTSVTVKPFTSLGYSLNNTYGYTERGSAAPLAV